MAGEPDFGPLLARPGFRADLLYFIRLAGNYAASIVIDCRAGAAKKHKAEFSHWLGLDVGQQRKSAPLAASPAALEARLFAQFLQRNRKLVSAVDNKALIKKDIWRALAFGHPWFDVFKTDFPTLMSEMPINMRERLSQSLQRDHLLPWNTKDFLAAIEDLTDYRGWLEHAQERIDRGEMRPPVGDARLLEILGLMLLPFLGNHLVGRIRHHGRRGGVRSHKAIADSAQHGLAVALASRRDTSKFMNGLKRRTDHESIRERITRKYGNVPNDEAVHRIAKEEAKKRRDLESQKAAMLAMYRRYFSEHTWPRYNYENFLIRFAFIGRRRIRALEEKLGMESQDRPDFMNVIEPAFMLAMDMALIIHVWLTELEEAGVPIRNKKQVGPVIPALRNAITHGDWLWEIADSARGRQALSFLELLTALLALPEQGRLNDGAQWRNNLLTRLEGALRPCGWAYVYAMSGAGDDPNQMPARHVIKRWSAAHRNKFADKARWRKEKRTPLRRLAAAWMRDIAAARAAALGKN